MEREIRVYATGTHRALPDCIRATVRLAGLKDTYEAAAEEFKDSFEFLLKETKQFVFKTADFSRQQRMEKKICGIYVFPHACLRVSFRYLRAWRVCIYVGAL